MIDPNPLLNPVTQLLGETLDALVSPPTNRRVEERINPLRRELDAALPDSPARHCLHAGLWLLSGNLEKAHVICQEISTPHGSAWHAVVHRMEADFWNSKYWWRRASGVKWEGLVERAVREIMPLPGEMGFLKSGRYDPAAFVDVVEAHGRSGPAELRAAMVALQRREWTGLFEECWIAAAAQSSKV